ncbi:hypothetical protein BSS2_I1286 [Brucella suis bv. 1 str. S2]|uniref:Uncharacterized protein n=4 Tax=Brucella TaxID=234 RepID=A9M5Y1_BRUC2|nr:hypothetical protein BR1323 [Brucella suis 1330]ABX62386.1 Hypothetical protein, conserved [Brucella canis ATCC 23365]ABY38416.1 Hypothetical protein, conserved [Brucella suis ATCC 23445]ACU48304.1 hypothetical protein BMI_I1335 [Brucella microti CCM 4915]AEK54638.1 hypothetical protein BPI_I1376 [Brucella pinnipedialis B2/94]AEU06323.1 hypothetical protein BSVBI22_A1319 [Brucella suis VBI22]AHN46941.1 hypothetical protein BSS2_I1286 [Brucella suis bv. 1 str. S2]CDL76710.1 unnamed protein
MRAVIMVFGLVRPNLPETLSCVFRRCTGRAKMPPQGWQRLKYLCGFRRAVARNVEFRRLREQCGIAIAKPDRLDLGCDGFHQDGADWLRSRCGLLACGRCGAAFGLPCSYATRLVEGITGLRGKIHSEQKGRKRQHARHEQHEAMLPVLLCLFPALRQIAETFSGVQPWNGASFHALCESSLIICFRMNKGILA